jgi:hypothetical protein
MAGPVSIEVKTTELDVVKDIFELIKVVSYDERIPFNVREELMDKVNEIIERER